MEIKMITQQEWELVKDLIPGDLLRKKAMIFAAVDEKKATGILVMEKGEREYSISVLWVHPDRRRQHVATELLHRAIEYVKKTDAEELSVSYNADENSYILDYMFSKMRFQVEVEKIPRYRITAEILNQSEMFKELSKKTKKNPNIIPFGKLSAYQLKEMQERFSQNGMHMVNRINLLEIDGKRSQVLLTDNVVKGLLLLKKKNGATEYEMVLFLVLPSQAASAVSLLVQTAQIVFEEPETVNCVEFICVNEKSHQLARKILGKEAYDDITLCHANLELDYARMFE